MYLRIYLQTVDESIGKLHKEVETKWRNITQCCAVINKLPEVIQEIEAITEKIGTVELIFMFLNINEFILGTLDLLFVTVEKSLIHLQDLIETRELQERQLDHRFQLALYKEKKLSQLENTRGWFYLF